MPKNQKAKLLKDSENLKQLIQTHIDYKAVLWENRETEFEKHINAMLDYYNRLRKELKSLDTKKDKNDELN